MLDAASRRIWESRARTLAWRINFAVWLEQAAPAFFYLSSVAAVSLYALRRLGGSLSGSWIALVLVTIVLGLAVAWSTRRRFFSASDARVLLESALHLDTRLTAATTGLVAWPRDVPVAPVVKWQLHRCAAWLGGAVLLLVLASRAPVPRTRDTVPLEKPPALAQAEAMLGALADAKLVEPQAIEQFEARARELARRTTAEQYTHSALEAADALRDQTAAATAALGRNLDSAANALSADSSASMEQSAGRLAAALQGLREGSLPANSNLLAHLPNDGSALSKLSEEQRSQLAREMANASRKARGIAGAAGSNARMAQPDPGRELSTASTAANGGLGGGKDGAPLGLFEKASDAGDGKAQALSPAALAHLSLGDRLGTTNAAPDSNSDQSVGPMSAGTIKASAKGGDAAWVDRLTPAERAALKNFFK